MKLSNLIKTLKRNYIPATIILSVLIIGLVFMSKSYFAKPQYLYVKVKVGQGFWWASTARPGKWYYDAIKKGDKQLDLVGKMQAKVIEKRIYKWYNTDQFDIYMNLYLRVSKNSKTGEYRYDRSVLSVGSPIEVSMPTLDITGTVIAMSNKDFQDKLESKIVYLSKRNAYAWEYDAIKIGDTYFDGENNIFEVIDKSAEDVSSFSRDNYGTAVGTQVELRKNITVKTKISVTNSENQYVLGEDQVLVAGKLFNFATSKFVFDNFFISSVE